MLKTIKWNEHLAENGVMFILRKAKRMELCEMGFARTKQLMTNEI